MILVVPKITLLETVIVFEKVAVFVTVMLFENVAKLDTVILSENVALAWKALFVLVIRPPPIATLPEILAVPVTVRAASGVVLFTPTLLFTESTNKVPESKLEFPEKEVGTAA